MAKVLLNMADGFLKQIDEFATEQHRTRSELIREALRTYMRRESLIATKNAEILEKLMQ